jgi:hypothetical protein
MTSSAKIHFDIEALLNDAIAQEIGLCITTNHPAGWLRIMYAHMRARPDQRVRIFKNPRSKTSFYLLNSNGVAEIAKANIELSTIENEQEQSLT